MSIWRDLLASDVAAPIDIAFGAACRRWDGGPHADLIGVSAALVSHARGRGSSCAPLADRAGRPFVDIRDSPADDTSAPPTLPPLETWRERLRASQLVSDGREATPLVLDAHDRLYLHRYWRAERETADFIAACMGAPAHEPTTDQIELWQRLFGPFGERPNWQAVAALAAMRCRFALVTGGPGTGKTWTVARILALLLQGNPKARIALAAPTGKAAARVTESIQGQIDAMGLHAQAEAAIPRQAQTIHRLLGYLPDGVFRFNAARPLPYDIVAVDEASMIDLLLMRHLIAALPPRCRLILLGDHDQLASVETGFVLGDIVRAADADHEHGAAFARVYREHAGADLPARADAPPLRDAVARLRESHRFKSDSGIGALAEAIRAGDADRALGALATGIAWRTRPAQPVDALADALPQYLACCRAQKPAEALDRFERTRALCGHRHGRFGVAGLNRTVERWLASQGAAVDDAFYRGRPILITANDYANRLFNGDVGICWPDPRGPRAWFRDDNGELRQLPVSRLPAHETAWVMTVHKTQGSEFDRVTLILPESDSPLCCRELFYTGATRAKIALTLIADEADVRRACAAGAPRASGLADLLGR